MNLCSVNEVPWDSGAWTWPWAPELQGATLHTQVQTCRHSGQRRSQAIGLMARCTSACLRSLRCCVPSVAKPNWARLPVATATPKATAPKAAMGDVGVAPPSASRGRNLGERTAAYQSQYPIPAVSIGTLNLPRSQDNACGTQMVKFVSKLLQS